jgi:hypothetical protein
MGGPSSNPIRCANLDKEKKDPGRGIGLEGSSERKKPFKSKWDSDMNFGLTSWLMVSLNAFL